MTSKSNLNLEIREAVKEDFEFVEGMMCHALEPYYGGDHKAHAKRILMTHLSGGIDKIGHFSFEQKMFILCLNSKTVGMIHLVGKRQGTYKISPIIIDKPFRGKYGLGSVLLEHAENYAIKKGARQIYCTVAEENEEAQSFFLEKGYIIAGKSESHYKYGITELMMYKIFLEPNFDEKFDRPNISVHLLEKKYELQVSDFLLEKLPEHFIGIDLKWIDALFKGFYRRNSRNINLKFKLIFVAIDRYDNVLGIAGATPKKGEPIKIMPFLAKTLPAFVALLSDIPFELRDYGHKLYIHITPSVEETIALQQNGWKLDAAMPEAYQEKIITQQWSLDIDDPNFARIIRTKKKYLDLMKKNKKTIEVRVAYKKMKSIKNGDRVKFRCRNSSYTTTIKDIRYYCSIKELLESEDSNKIIPNRSKEEVLKILKDIYPEKLENLGMMALELNLNEKK